MDRLPPTSPCVGRCVIDEAARLCTGCARSLDEIAVWGSASDDFRAGVWAQLPARSATLGLRARRLELRGDAVLIETARRISEDRARLVAGVWGASGELMRQSGAPCDMEIGDDILTMTVPGGAIRLEAARYMTAFEMERPDEAPLLALAVPLGRAFRDCPRTLTALGRDTDALLPRDRDGQRFDLGLGRRTARFTVRCDAALAATLGRGTGLPWPDHLVNLGQPLFQASPVRVIETPCLRLEIDAQIPPPDGASPDGPHTHLLPDHVAQALDTPPTVPLPAGYALCALIYPASS
jgi:predicted Fe-S protein YdhL (DUF1289 family)